MSAVSRAGLQFTVIFQRNSDLFPGSSPNATTYREIVWTRNGPEGGEVTSIIASALSTFSLQSIVFWRTVQRKGNRPSTAA
jgi:hypothetical protein